MRKYNWKKILISTLWVLAGIGAIVLLGAAIQKKNQKVCADIKIEITGVERHMFIDEKDVLHLLEATGKVKGSPISLLNLRQMENSVEKNAWVKNAEMFLDNNQVLQVQIEERQPIARVFTLEGTSFYLDSSALRLPLSDKLSARVPSFTGFPSDKKVLAKPDSMLLKDIVAVGKYIMADSFWMAQVAQVDINPASGFEMIPVVGDHVVVLGNAEDLDRKFKHLYTFYKQAWLQNGINTYEKLDVQYTNQVVAVKKGAGKAWIDSARAHAAIQNLMMQQPVMQAMDSAGNLEATPKPVVKRKDSVTTKPAVIAKPVVKIPVKTKSVAATNNKNNKKPLTKGKKQSPAKTAKKKTVVKGRQPKAVLKK